MRRRHTILILAALLTVILAGCGIKAFMPGKEVPPLEDYNTVLLLPFDFVKNPKPEYTTLPTQISYAIGTKLKVRRDQKSWFYDQSQEVRPVSIKLAELGVSGKDIFKNPQAASKVAEAFQADLIIAGRLDVPEFTREEPGKIYEDKSEHTSMKSGSRFYTIYQTALLPAYIKIIKPKTNEVIWDGKIVGYKKYETRYRTGSPKSFQQEETMLAEVRRELVDNLANKLYPTVIAPSE